jgi:outer membrane receptor protein involved in Fe transport
LKTTLMAGAAVITVAGAAPAFAQDQVEKVTVTGTRIPQKGLSSVSPVSTITNAEAKAQGTTSAETLLNNLPQVFAGQGAEVSNGSSGQATVDLRGLGPQRTLVLINGRRFQPGSIVNGGSPLTDLNQIPTALIERVEVLTGGASAVYGADAVGGVVNFIMRKDFEGVELGVFYGIADHENDDEVSRARIAIREALNPAEFRRPATHVNDGRIVSVYGVMGANTADDKGNVTLYAQYRNSQPILQSSRDFSACSVTSNFDGTFFCQGSNGTPARGRFDSLDDVGAAFPGAGVFSAGGTVAVRTAADAFNFAPQNYLQRPDDRYQLGAMGRYNLSGDLEIFGELSFSDDHSLAQIATSGMFFGGGPAGGGVVVNCDNPFLTIGAAPNAFDALCGNAGLTTTDTATFLLGRRFVELGPRIDDLRHTSYRGVVGLKGQIDESWEYDVHFMRGVTTVQETYLNEVSIERSSRALLAVDLGGGPQCAPGVLAVDPNCVPLNIFQPGAISAAALQYVSSSGQQQGETTTTNIVAALTGDLGVTLPAAESPIAVALGAEYRQETAVLRTDRAFETGDLYGQGGPVRSLSGHYDVWEAFGEVAIPLVEDATWAKSLELVGGYRISDYDTSGITHTYKYGLTWAPIDDIKFRGSFQRAVRAPSITELFSPVAPGLWGGTDPCAGTTPALTPTQCANTGVTPPPGGTYGTVPQCPAAQCSGVFGGNTSLKPEESDTKSFGIVLTPSFLKGFVAQIDYFDIFLDKAIGVPPPAAVLADCALNATPASCALITRGAGGILFGAGQVSLINQNLGSRQTKGVDIDANWKIGLEEAGSLTFGFVGTWVDEFHFQPVAGSHAFDYNCEGTFGVVCGTPTFTWRHSLRTTWSSPFDMDFSVNWRHMGGVELDLNRDNALFNIAGCGAPCGDLSDAFIREFDYFDIMVAWNASENITLRGGINNVLDRDPPILDSNTLGVSSPPFGNANTYPVVYDSLGREVFISLQTKF